MKQPMDPALRATASDGSYRDESHRHQQLEQLLANLTRRCPTCFLRLNNNAKTMLSLRERQGGSVVSVHVGLLDHPLALEELPAWIASRGRRMTQILRAALQQVWREQRNRQIAATPNILPELETIREKIDLQESLRQVHATWFCDLTTPSIRWGRQCPQRRLTSIRFACYRSKPTPVIVVNPRLAQPWVARIFFDHVLFHELCHHAQASSPIRGEPPHSRRFRQWESRYPHHDLARAWERANLDRFLTP